GESPALPPHMDRANTRCFENKRRFGVDLLYPIERYVEALTQGEIVDARNGEVRDNPLLRGVGANVGTRRGSDRVFLSVISGVPWQDIATLRSLNDDGTLDFVTARELVEPLEELGVSRWQVILGEPGKAEGRGL